MRPEGLIQHASVAWMPTLSAYTGELRRGDGRPDASEMERHAYKIAVHSFRCGRRRCHMPGR